MGLLGPPNIRKLKAKGKVKGLIKALGYKDWFIRNSAAEALGEIGDVRAVEPLIAALIDPNGDIRRASASALGKIGDVRAVEPLIAVLKINSVSKDAAKALDTLEWTPDEGEAGAYYLAAKLQWDKCVQIGSLAVEPLITMLGDSDENIRRASASALGEIGDARAVKPLIAVLVDRDENVRRASADALGKIGDVRAVMPLIDRLNADNVYLRMAFADALVKFGSQAVEPLITALKDCFETKREAAIDLLGKIGDVRAVEPLIASLKDANKSVRWASARALERFGSQTVEPLIVVLDDPKNPLRKAAIDLLGKIGDVRAAEPLIIALKDPHKDIRRASASALGNIGDVRAVGPLIAVLKDLNEHEREPAIEALGNIGDVRAVEPLTAVLKDLNEHERELAIEALERLGWTPDEDEAGAYYWVVKLEWEKCVRIGSPAVEPLIAALKNPDWLVRKPAAEALITIYKNKLLDKKSKIKILDLKSTITEAHGDISIGSDCGKHTDRGIGVSFPV